MSRTISLCAALAALLLAACATPPPNAGGMATVAINPGIAGPVQGVGIEGQDIISMSDQMLRDMLTSPRLTTATGGKAPRVIIDAQQFKNDSTQPINRNLITDRLRVGLNRASGGRMVFISGENLAAVAAARDQKFSGVTDAGTVGVARKMMGVDYQLIGRISSIDQRSARSGLVQRYTQITFEMLDMSSAEVVWSGIYEFARAAGDDVVYR